VGTSGSAVGLGRPGRADFPPPPPLPFLLPLRCALEEATTRRRRWPDSNFETLPSLFLPTPRSWQGVCDPATVANVGVGNSGDLFSFFRSSCAQKGEVNGAGGSGYTR